MKTILLPTDFSDNSYKAIEYAIEHLASPDSLMLLANVYQIPQGGTSGLFTLLDELRQQAEKDMKDFQALLEKDFADKPVRFESRIMHGDFEEQTHVLARNMGVDCIVMGTKGATGLREALLGSNTAQIMKYLKDPLYVIPVDDEIKAAEEIIFAYDGSELTDETLQPLKQLVQEKALPLRLLHIRIKEDAPIQDWKTIEDQLDGISLSVHECWGESFEDGLKNGIEGANGILVMVRHKQSFWERFFNRSDSRTAVMHAQLPMLIIPE